MADETRGGAEIQALLGAGTSYEGKLAFEGRVRIDGKFRGEVSSTGVLIVGDGAEVDAKLSVGALIVKGGKVRGDIHAVQCVELHAGGEIHGDIHSPQVFIEKGAAFHGRCTMPNAETHPLPE